MVKHEEYSKRLKNRFCRIQHDWEFRAFSVHLYEMAFVYSVLAQEVSQTIAVNGFAVSNSGFDDGMAPIGTAVEQIALAGLIR